MATHLQYSCLDTSMEREAWWATVHVVAESQTRLSTSAGAQHEYPPNPFTLLQMVTWLSSIHKYIYVASSLSVHLLMGVWVVSIFWLL